MLKKAQISALVIIAVLVLAGVGIFFIFQKKPENKNISDEDSRKVYSFVENCIREKAEQGVYYAGMTGGYIKIQTLSNDKNVAYYVYENNSYIPKKEKIEKELANYLSDNLGLCLNNFSDFPGLEIKSGEIQTGARIKNGVVSFNADYPLTIIKSNRTSYLSKFENIEVPINLEKIYSVAEKTTQGQRGSGFLCISCINKIAVQNGVYVEVSESVLAEDGYVFTIIDENSRINDNAYRFSFAVL